MSIFLRRTALAAWLLVTSSAVCASVGLDVIAARDGAGPITLFYLTIAPAAAVKRGKFVVNMALHADPVVGNRRMIVISHDSGGSAGLQSDLARTLVEAGFVVALPEHRVDNWHDVTLVGPES